jgi:hypothetical protein
MYEAIKVKEPISDPIILPESIVINISSSLSSSGACKASIV